MKTPSQRPRRQAPKIRGVSLVLALGFGQSYAFAEPSPPAAESAPRPEQLPPLKPNPPASVRSLEVGADVAFVARFASEENTKARYAPALGLSIHGAFEIWKYLRTSIYLVHSTHDVRLPVDELVLGGCACNTTIVDPSVTTYAFGARFHPTLPLGSRARAWSTVGIGWGRFEFDRMKLTQAELDYMVVHERSFAFLEVPIGIGASYDIVPNWLSVELQTIGAFVFDETGDALNEAQSIDDAGHRHTIKAMPRLDASFVQTLGISLVL